MCAMLSKQPANSTAKKSQPETYVTHMQKDIQVHVEISNEPRVNSEWIRDPTNIDNKQSFGKPNDFVKIAE